MDPASVLNDLLIGNHQGHDSPMDPGRWRDRDVDPVQHGHGPPVPTDLDPYKGIIVTRLV